MPAPRSDGQSDRAPSPGLPPKRALNASTTAFTVRKGCRIRPEIDSARRAAGRAHQRLRELEIAAEGLENVLPGPHRVRVAQAHGPPGLERADAIGNQTGRPTSRRRR